MVVTANQGTSAWMQHRCHAWTFWPLHGRRSTAVAFTQLTRTVMALALLLIPTGVFAQYSPNNLKPRPYNPTPSYPRPQPTYSPQRSNNGPVVIYQNHKPTVCHTYNGVTRCP
jgi:hypothetical protein